jgi:hypothetical protein
MAPAKKAAQPLNSRDLEKDIGAAKVLKAHLVELLGDDGSDAEVIRDAIEGETDLFETIDAVVGQIGLDEASAAGIERFASTLSARKARLEKRADMLRVTVMNAIDTISRDEAHKAQLESIVKSIAHRAMVALTGGKVDATIATISLRATAPKLVTTNEAEIPTSFFKTPDPVLDRTALTNALKDHRDTLRQKLDELDQKRVAEGMDEKTYADFRERLIAAFPAIPGAELGDGGGTVSIRFS